MISASPQDIRAGQSHGAQPGARRRTAQPRQVFDDPGKITTRWTGVDAGSISRAPPRRCPWSFSPGEWAMPHRCCRYMICQGALPCGSAMGYAVLGLECRSAAGCVGGAAGAENGGACGCTTGVTATTTETPRPRGSVPRTRPHARQPKTGTTNRRDGSVTRRDAHMRGRLSAPQRACVTCWRRHAAAETLDFATSHGPRHRAQGPWPRSGRTRESAGLFRHLDVELSQGGGREERSSPGRRSCPRRVPTTSTSTSAHRRGGAARPQRPRGRIVATREVGLGTHTHVTARRYLDGATLLEEFRERGLAGVGARGSKDPTAALCRRRIGWRIRPMGTTSCWGTRTKDGVQNPNPHSNISGGSSGTSSPSRVYPRHHRRRVQLWPPDAICHRAVVEDPKLAARRRVAAGAGGGDPDAELRRPSVRLRRGCGASRDALRGSPGARAASKPRPRRAAKVAELGAGREWVPVRFASNDRPGSREAATDATRRRRRRGAPRGVASSTERWSPIHGGVVENWLWAVGTPPARPVLGVSDDSGASASSAAATRGRLRREEPRAADLLHGVAHAQHQRRVREAHRRCAGDDDVGAPVLKSSKGTWLAGRTGTRARRPRPRRRRSRRRSWRRTGSRGRTRRSRASSGAPPAAARTSRRRRAAVVHHPGPPRTGSAGAQAGTGATRARPVCGAAGGALGGPARNGRRRRRRRPGTGTARGRPPPPAAWSRPVARVAARSRKPRVEGTRGWSVQAEGARGLSDTTNRYPSLLCTRKKKRSRWKVRRHARRSPENAWNTCGGLHGARVRTGRHLVLPRPCHHSPAVLKGLCRHRARWPSARR